MNDWKTRSLNIVWLRHKAIDYEDERSVFDWLKYIDVVPGDVRTMPMVKPRLDVDPANIPAGYLASVAFEWDSWGVSSPVDFVNAIEAECVGERRDYIAALLTLLGREEETHVEVAA